MTNHQPGLAPGVKIEISNTAKIFGGETGTLTGEALEQERRGRRQLAHSMHAERLRQWKAGQWPTPEIAFWARESDIDGA